jgi:hypothetical protein
MIIPVCVCVWMTVGWWVEGRIQCGRIERGRLAGIEGYDVDGRSPNKVMPTPVPTTSRMWRKS